MEKIDKNFLKIDIEGSEYRILDQILNNAKKLMGLLSNFIILIYIKKLLKILLRILA